MNCKECLHFPICGLSANPNEVACDYFYANQKTGHWIEHPKNIYAHLVCDKCLSNAPYDCQTNYCPNCGAKMEELKGE